MLGRKERDCKVHSALSLEDRVPVNDYYRQVEAKLDLSFVRELVQGGQQQISQQGRYRK